MPRARPTAAPSTRWGSPSNASGVAGSDVDRQLEAYRAVLDGTVVRALPVQWRLDELLAIAESARRG